LSIGKPPVFLGFQLGSDDLYLYAGLIGVLSDCCLVDTNGYGCDIEKSRGIWVFHVWPGLPGKAFARLIFNVCDAENVLYHSSYYSSLSQNSAYVSVGPFCLLMKCEYGDTPQLP